MYLRIGQAIIVCTKEYRILTILKTCDPLVLHHCINESYEANVEEHQYTQPTYNHIL
ncbi:hypothetical protein Hanom_Chr05g00434931 [Helianthus anomalus]